MRQHRNNSGVTLVELIVCIAISAIILTMIALIIKTASNSFRRTNEDVNLQMESQIAMNQLSTYIMEASGVYPDRDGVTDDDKKYVIKYVSQEDGIATTTYHVLYYINDLNCLYLITDTDPAEVTLDSVKNHEAEYLMAEHVTDISIDNSDGTKAVTTLTFGLGDQDYTVRQTIRLRNAKKASEDGD